jgi:CHAD domain-containing protein
MVGPWAQTQLSLIGAKFFEAVPNQTSSLASLHQFRIRAKALRYAIELVAGGFPAELRDSAYPLIESVQERLGRVQDLVTACGRFEAWAADDDYASFHPLLRELVRSEAKKLDDTVQEFHSWWDQGKVAALRRILPLDATGSSAEPSEFDGAAKETHQEADRQTQPAP